MQRANLDAEAGVFLWWACQLGVDPPVLSSPLEQIATCHRYWRVSPTSLHPSRPLTRVHLC